MCFSEKYVLNSEFYMKHRLRWTLVARFISSGAETVSFMYHPPPKMHIGSVVKSLLVFSPASNLFIVSITLRLPFLQHIAVQIVLFSMALFWLAPFCRSCIDHAAIFEKVGCFLTSFVIVLFRWVMESMDSFLL